MTHEELIAGLTGKFPSSIVPMPVHRGELTLIVGKDDIVRV